MISKKKTLALSFGGFVLQIILISFAYSSLFDSCYNNLSCRESFLNLLVIISPYVHLFVPLFIFSLITYWMRDEIYQAWFKFARWWIPFSMLAILVAPEYSSDWMYPIEKGTVAFLSSLLFLVISLSIILVKYFRSDR